MSHANSTAVDERHHPEFLGPEMGTRALGGTCSLKQAAATSGILAVNPPHMP